jgi:Fe-S oxidoreductase
MNVVTKLRDWAVSGESPEIDGIFSRDELLSCTTCGRCVTECPVQIDHVGLITDLRRDLVYEGDMDAGHQRTMQRLSEVDNPYGQPAAARGGWALSEGFEEVADGQQYDYLYWLGCASSFDTRAQDVARTVHKLLKAAGCRVGTLASREKCTGDAARRIGDEGLFQKLALANIEAIRGVQFKAIVTHCPHCLNAIKNEYRLLGGDFEVRHHTEVLADLVASGAIELKRQLSERATYHDPCYLGRHNGVFDAPRALLDAIPSLDLVEMARSREKSACCGAGGGQMWLGEELGDKKINVIRVEDVLETGASTIVTGCQFCTVMLEEGVQLQNQDASIRVRDISEMIAEAADLA